MKQIRHRILALASAALTVTVLSGCWTSPKQLPAVAESSPDRNWLVMETGKGTAVMHLTNESIPQEPSSAKARVILIDRSYRLVTVMYGDGHTDTFKVGLPDTLEHVRRGDNAIVRSLAPQGKGA